MGAWGEGSALPDAITSWAEHMTHMGIADAKALDDAREAVGEAWLAGDVTLADAIRAKVAMLEAHLTEAAWKTGRDVPDESGPDHLTDEDRLVLEESRLRAVIRAALAELERTDGEARSAAIMLASALERSVADDADALEMDGET